MEAKKDKYIISNGSQAAIKSIYNFIDAFYIFPITPSTAVSFGIKNLFLTHKPNIQNFIPYVHQYQSEAGVAAGIHGALQMGVLASTCTGSQGLLLMIPDIYKIVGGLLPGVFHVASRTIATRSLSIMGDHSDAYSVRTTGIAMIASSSVQEIHDLAAIVYPIALESSYPIMHFYEANVLSNVLTKIVPLTSDQYKKILNKEYYKNLKKFRERALTPFKPVSKGGHENPDTLFQGREAANKYIANVGVSAKKQLALLSKITGREYKPYSYFGPKNAKLLIVAMGAICENIKPVLLNLNKKYNMHCGLVQIRLYRPFLSKDFVRVIPKTAKKIAIISRTKENGSPSEPLFVDAVTALVNQKFSFDFVCNGRYGLGSKNITDGNIKAIYDNLYSKKPKIDFTIGIVDDVTQLSLPLNKNYKLKRVSKHNIIFYGVGGDGTVSLAESITKIIASKFSKLHFQLYSLFNSLKQNNITQSLLNMRDKPIYGYQIARKFSYVVVSMDTIILQTNILMKAKNNSVVLVNTSFNSEEFKLFMPNSFKRNLARKNCSLFIINANKIALENKLNYKVSTILAASVFKILYPNNQYFIKKLKTMATQMFSKKGQKIVEANINAINDVNHKNISQVHIENSWKNIKIFKEKSFGDDPFDKYLDVVESLEGDNLKVSEVKTCGTTEIADGTLINNNNTFKAKRKVNSLTPRWIPERCIQCNKCALVCPHATIRAFLLSPSDIKNAPQQFETLHAVGAEGYRFRIQVDAENCVGCSLCATACPVDALEMVPAKEEQDKYTPLTNYLYKDITYKTGDFSTDMYKGVSFLYPYFEASGACKGCGETPYYRLLTQLFGKFMVIANATGCTSIFGGHQATPFAVDKDGCGPAWSNSLFEDNAEFGLGMRMAEDTKIHKMINIITESIGDCEPSLQRLLQPIIKKYHTDDRLKQFKNREKLIKLISASKCKKIKKLMQYKDSFVRKSMWMIGGDGWAFDIGFGGIRHAVDSGKNINILILNTETYSNTGGQISAASPSAAGGKPTYHAALKTELGQMLLTHKNVYVAQVSLGMNPNQTIKAFQEAESYDGPSVVIAYCPCISHGFDLKNHSLNEREAVLSGYWPIFRYDPRLINQSKNPLQIDFKAPKFETIPRFLFPQRRFINEYKLLKNVEIEKVNAFINYLKRNFETLQTLSMQTFSPDSDYFKDIHEEIGKYTKIK